ncbi:hypothetical protein [Caulobacter sp. BE254]|uniref:hypothetical protein n=1 Tax=Caulobacter sp. BE254 TaxID=2817720 RepID=UPI00285E840C|nr:hypothetical protein [Caulobacter sp. BE254]MDR7115135.1 hypothetical protein [Caulobacter sp. BE254]
MRRLKMAGIVVAAFALASSGPTPATLPYQFIDRPDDGGLSLKYENTSNGAVCIRGDWPFNSGPNGGPVVLEVAGRRFPLRPEAWAVCKKNCTERMWTGTSRGWNLPYTAFGLPEELTSAPKTIDASLVAASCKGTKPLPEELFETSEWIPVGSTEKQICAAFRRVTQWDNRDRISYAHNGGDRVGDVQEYDREQFPGGSIYNSLVSLSDSQLAEPTDTNGRYLRFYILAERDKARGRSTIDRMRHLLVSALTPASELGDFDGPNESIRLKQSRMLGTYVPAMCSLQALCRPHGVVKTANKLPCGDLNINASRPITPPQVPNVAPESSQSRSIVTKATGAQTSPEVGHPFGYSAVIEIRLPSGSKGFPCSLGGGVCTAKFARWTAFPDRAQATKFISLAGRVEGVTETTCRVGPKGDLVRCRSKGVMDEHVAAAIDSSVPLMRVPETMLDLPTKGGTVSISWNWRELSQGVWLTPRPNEADD